jgi:signal-transduction protein with cAMP-binding, CBS, and nucleotidyltransferase domain
MTSSAEAISPETSLIEAQRIMRECSLQQLPVLAEGTLHGILLERDLLLARQLGANFETTPVRTLLPHDAFCVLPNEPLPSAVRAMASRAAVCAVVVEGAEVRGVLTATDALRLLADMLEAEQAANARDSSPCGVLDEGCLLSRAEDTAQRLLSGDADSASTDGLHDLRNAVKELYEERLARVEAEARELVCTQDAPLRRNHLEQQHSAHKQQAQLLEGLLMGLDDLTQPVEALATGVKRAVRSLRTELERDRDALRFMS